MIVGDTSWVAALRDPTDAHHEAAVRVDDALGDENVVLAAVTLAECLVAPAILDEVDSGELDRAELALRAAYEIVEVDDDAPRRWAAMRAKRRLRLPDAIILSTAVSRGARGVATFDSRLAKATRAQGLDVLQ